MPRTKVQNFSSKDYYLAKRLLREYDEAVTPGGKGNRTTQSLHLTKAYAAFLAEADQKDVTRDNFRKLLSRIRVKQAAKSGSSSSSAAATTDNEGNAGANTEENVEEEDKDEDPAELEQRRREEAWRKQSRKTGNVPLSAPPPEFDPDTPLSTAGENDAIFSYISVLFYVEK